MGKRGPQSGLWRDSRGCWRSWIDGRCRSFGRDRRVALRSLGEAKRGAAPSAPAKLRRPLLLGQLPEYWLAHRGGDAERRHLRHWTEFVGTQLCADLDADTLHRFVAWLKTQTYHRGKPRRPPRPYSPKSVREFTLLAGRMLRWAHGRGYVALIPETPRLPKPARQPRDVPPDALARMLTAPTKRRGRKPLRPMPVRVARLFRFAIETGLRPGECCRVKWEHVSDGMLIVPEHKTMGKTLAARSVPLTPEATAILEQCQRLGAYVFISRLRAPYSPSGLRSILRRRGATPYQLRHTFAQQRSEHLPLDVLAQWLGHSNLETVKFYRQIRDERLKASARQLRPVLPG